MSRYDKYQYDLTSFSGRIGMLVLRLSHGNQSEFARQIGLSRQHVNQWMKLDHPTPGAVGRVLARYPEVNTDWLMSGDGEMLLPSVTLSPEFAGDGAPSGLFAIPFVSPKQSARGVELEETGTSRFVDRDRFQERFGSLPDGYADYVVVGDSMEPTIRAGDILTLQMFRPGSTILDGAIYLLSGRSEGKITAMGLRRLRFFNTQIHLEPDNPVYERTSIDLDRFEDLMTLHGVVKWSTRMH